MKALLGLRMPVDRSDLGPVYMPTYCTSVSTVKLVAPPRPPPGLCWRREEGGRGWQIVWEGDAACCTLATVGQAVFLSCASATWSANVSCVAGTDPQVTWGVPTRWPPSGSPGRCCNYSRRKALCPQQSSSLSGRSASSRTTQSLTCATTRTCSLGPLVARWGADGFLTDLVLFLPPQASDFPIPFWYPGHIWTSTTLWCV